MAASAANASAPIEVRFDTASASIDAIQRAAYRYCDRFSCELVPGRSEHLCLLSAVAGTDVDKEIAGFRTEVLDQVLRERIRGETEPIRTMILAHAFSKTGITESRDST